MSSTANFSAKDRLQLLEALLSTASALRVMANEMPPSSGRTEVVRHIESLNSSLDSMLERLKEVVNG